MKNFDVYPVIERGKLNCNQVCLFVCLSMCITQNLYIRSRICFYTSRGSILIKDGLDLDNMKLS